MLPSLTVAFIAGLLVGSQIPYFPLSASFLLLLAALGAFILERLNRFTVRQATWLYGALLVGVVYWAVVVTLAANTTMGDYPSDTVIEVTGRIVAPVQQAPDRLVMIIKSDDPATASGASRHVRLTWRTPERLFFQGDRVRFRAMLRRPSGSLNPGGFDYAGYLERQGIDAIATVTGSEAVQLLESGREHAWWAIWNKFDRWRGSIRLAALQTLPQPALGLYLGIIIGDRGYLDPELRDQFMVTGTVHLLIHFREPPGPRRAAHLRGRQMGDDSVAWRLASCAVSENHADSHRRCLYAPSCRRLCLPGRGRTGDDAVVADGNCWAECDLARPGAPSVPCPLCRRGGDLAARSSGAVRYLLSALLFVRHRHCRVALLAER